MIGHTTAAHRLCSKAAQTSGQEALLKMIKTIFTVHMVDGKDISDLNILADIAESVGVMPKDQVSRVLN